MLMPKQTSKPRDPKRLYSVSEAATYLGRSEWGLRYMIAVGRLPVVRDGRRVLLDILDLDAFVERNKVNGFSVF